MEENDFALLFASSNPGKHTEIKALLEGLPLKLHSPEEYGRARDVAETGQTYLENAKIKAITAAEQYGVWALADDTGLEVDALNGAPGLHSARLLGSGASDADRRARLLEMLQGAPRPWIARFRCAAVFAGPDGEQAHAEGQCEGEIIPQEYGGRGFGYDAIFMVAGTGKTMAELSLEEKNRISHRAQAIRSLLPDIKQTLGIAD